MSLAKILSFVLLACLALAAAGALRRVALWRRGRPAHVPLVTGLLAMPKRYLVDLHGVVARDRYSANMHVAVAGGLVAALVLIALAHLPWPAWRAPSSSPAPRSSRSWLAMRKPAPSSVCSCRMRRRSRASRFSKPSPGINR